MDTIAADVERALPTYSPGDGNSWWATTADGTERCVRLQHFHDHSPTTLAILTSDRWDQLRRTLQGDDALVSRPMDSNVIEALVKPLAVTKGISDVPWHRDCNLGRHAYGCCSTTVGISVTDGGEGRGQLRVVPGSHRLLMPSSVAGTDAAWLPALPLPTRKGDLTVHLSCTLHEAQPPITGERIVMYTGFGLTGRRRHGHPRQLTATPRAHPGERAVHDLAGPEPAGGGRALGGGGEAAHGLAHVDAAEGHHRDRRGGDPVVDVALDVRAALRRASRGRSARRRPRRGWPRARPRGRRPSRPPTSARAASPRPSHSWNAA